MAKTSNSTNKGVSVPESDHQPVKKKETNYLRLAILLALVGIFAIIERMTFVDVYRTSIEHQKFLRSISHEKIDHVLEIFCEMG